MIAQHPTTGVYMVTLPSVAPPKSASAGRGFAEIVALPDFIYTPNVVRNSA
jgi:hypothetical protein